MPFDFTAAMRELIADIAATCPELGHLDLSLIAVTFSQTRAARLGGVQATILPLRFPDGSRIQERPHGTYELPLVKLDGREMLYVVAFRLPRFLNRPFQEKMTTVVHEMYHISPDFDGTLRRFEGGKPYHTGSRRRYDAAMAAAAGRYLEATRRPELHGFLHRSFAELAAAHGGVVAMKMRGIRLRRIR